MIRRLVALAGVLGLALGTLLLLGTGPAFACSCVMADTAQHAADADVVITGQVAGVTRDRQQATYLVRADRVYKGSVADRDVVINTNASSTACGVDVPESREAVFFATQGSNGLETSVCAGSGELSSDLRAEVVAALGDGHAPPGLPGDDPGTSGTSHGDDAAASSDHTLAFAVGGGVAALVVAALLGWLVRRRAGRTSRA